MDALGPVSSILPRIETIHIPNSMHIDAAFSAKQNKKIIENVCKSMLQQVIRRMGSHKFQSFPILFIEIDRRRHATSLA